MMHFEHINAMGGQELNILAAEEILGWRMDGDQWLGADGVPTRRVTEWYPSGDPCQADDLVETVCAKGFGLAYAQALCRVLGLTPPLSDPDDIFRLATATPKDRCKAAVIAVMVG